MNQNFGKSRFLRGNYTGKQLAIAEIYYKISLGLFNHSFRQVIKSDVIFLSRIITGWGGRRRASFAKFSSHRSLKGRIQDLEKKGGADLARLCATTDRIQPPPLIKNNGATHPCKYTRKGSYFEHWASTTLSPRWVTDSIIFE